MIAVVGRGDLNEGKLPVMYTGRVDGAAVVNGGIQSGSARREAPLAKY
jgi:hypothetical protein